MKVGDLVVWLDRDGRRGQQGIIVDGPRDGCSGDSPATSYAVAWFDAKTTFWHNDYNLELLSDCHRIMPDDLRGSEV